MIDNGDDGLSARMVLRTELTRQRERAKLTLAELSDRCTYDSSYLQRLEKGDRLGSIEAIGALDTIYGTGDHLKELWRLARREVKPNRYQRYMDLEAEATAIQEFSVSTVPGLLQTKRYAEAQLRTARPESEEQLAEQLMVRLNRQVRLTEAKAPHYRALLDESVIQRPPRDSDLWKEQLERLISDAGSPNISMQVVPFRAGLHDLLGGSLTLLWLPGGRNIAYVESSQSGQLIEEAEEVERLRLSYDLLRDSALSPGESADLLRTVLEDSTSCAPRTQP